MSEVKSHRHCKCGEVLDSIREGEYALIIPYRESIKAITYLYICKPCGLIWAEYCGENKKEENNFFQL